MKIIDQLKKVNLIQFVPDVYKRQELMMDQVPTEEHDILMDQVICDE